MPVGLDYEEQESNSSYDQMTPAERLKLAHAEAHGWLLDLRTNVFTTISGFENVQSVNLDFIDAYCPHGCWRVLELDWPTALKQVKSFWFSGIRSIAEARELFSAWMEHAQLTMEKIMEQYQVVFAMEESREAWGLPS